MASKTINCVRVATREDLGIPKARHDTFEENDQGTGNTNFSWKQERSQLIVSQLSNQRFWGAYPRMVAKPKHSYFCPVNICQGVRGFDGAKRNRQKRRWSREHGQKHDRRPHPARWRLAAHAVREALRTRVPARSAGELTILFEKRCIPQRATEGAEELSAQAQSAIVQCARCQQGRESYQLHLWRSQVLEASNYWWDPAQDTEFWHGLPRRFESS